MDFVNKFLEKYINKIIILFILLNPFFDLLTSIFINVIKINFNLVLVFKMFLLLILIYYYLFLIKNKNNNIKFSLIFISIYLIINVTLILIFKNNIFFYEIKNTFRAFFFPITFLIIYQMYLSKRININCNYLIYSVILYLILLFIPLITKTGFNSYSYSKVGSIGWFNSTNEVGGIISIFLPLLFAKLMNIKNLILKLVLLLVIVFIYTMIGSKVPTLTLGIVIIFTILIYLCKAFKTKNKKNILIITSLIFILFAITIYIIPKTSFYENIKIHTKFLKIEKISDVFTIKNIDRFIFSDRISFMEKTINNYNGATIYEKLFGIGYVEKYSTDMVNVKMIEIDYYDILFRHGIIGFIVYFFPLVILFKENCKKFLFHDIYFNLSIILVFILALFSGHIFLSPSVSYMIIFLFINFINCKENLNENRISLSKL